MREAILEYSGEPNMFTGAISLQDASPNARLVVLANDADRANFWDEYRCEGRESALKS